MGISERALAKALGARRKDVAVVTKGGVGYPDAPNRRDSTPPATDGRAGQSLRNLATDHVDVYLVHWPDVNTPFEETMQTLDDVVRQGKARYVGVSNFRLTQLEACMPLRRMDVVQYGWNMFDRRMQPEIFPWCQENNVGVMAYGSLAYGLLTGTFHEGMSFDETDWRAKRGALGSLNLFRTMLRPRPFPAQPGGGGGVEGHRRGIRQDVAAIGAELDHGQPRHRHVAGGLPPPGGDRGEPGRTGLEAVDGGYRRYRRRLRPPSRRHGTGGLAGRRPAGPDTLTRRFAMPVQTFAPMTKDFPTFDCDAHVTEPPRIWERARYLTKDELEALKTTIWWDAESQQLIVNGKAGVGIGSQRRGGIPGTMRVITNAGPGVKHDIQRALNVRNLNPRPLSPRSK